MRTIKFRSWNKREKKMDCPDHIANNVDTEKYQIMQFTGFLDQDGKEIYEGDIVKCPITGESADYLQLEADKKDFVIREIRFPEVYMEGLPDSCEVIGNIYENKELLK